MADKAAGFPQIPARVWWGVRDLLNRSPKMKFDDGSLAATLDVQPAAARQYLTELKRIGLLDEKGAATELGERWRQESAGAFDVRRRGGDGELHLDPSGVVKGWAVERAARPLRHLAETDFCLSAGGDMVCVTGPESAPWRVGIEDPGDPARVVAVVPVRNGAVATSGLVHRGAHITDARTGRVPTEVASVSVIADDLIRADLDATAAFALDDEGVGWLRERGSTAVVVWADGRREVVGERARPCGQQGG